MKKKLFVNIVTGVLFTGASLHVVMAQSITPPTFFIAEPTTFVVEPAPTQEVVPPPEPAPAPAGMLVPPPAPTQEPAPAPAPEPTPPAVRPLPPPDLPILEVPPARETQELCRVVPDDGMCLNPDEAGNMLIPPLLNNQLKIALVLLLGSGVGAVFWVVMANILSGAQIHRDEQRFRRQSRLEALEQKSEKMTKNAHKLIDSIANIFKHAGDKMMIDKQALEQYKKTSVDIELFGSDETVAANRDLSELLSHAKGTTLEELTAAKNRLVKALKKDLGLR